MVLWRGVAVAVLVADARVVMLRLEMVSEVLGSGGFGSAAELWQYGSFILGGGG